MIEAKKGWDYRRIKPLIAGNRIVEAIMNEGEKGSEILQAPLYNVHTGCLDLILDKGRSS